MRLGILEIGTENPSSPANGSGSAVSSCNGELDGAEAPAQLATKPEIF